MDILKRFRMLDYKEITTFMELNLKILCDASAESDDAMMYHHIISSLVYLTNTRPDICFAVNNLSQFLMDLRHAHMVAKHAVRYLKVQLSMGSSMIRIGRLTCMVMLIRIGSAIEKKSTLGCFFSLRSQRFMR